MRRDTYTLSDADLVAISRRQDINALDARGQRRHYFLSTNYDDLMTDPSVVNPRYMHANGMARIQKIKPDYMLIYVGRDILNPFGIIIGWFDQTEDNWHVPPVARAIPPSLYRIRSFIEGLRWGRITSIEEG